MRTQLSTHVVPTIKETYRFLRSLAALDSNDTSLDVPQLVRDFLSRTDVPSFVDETSPRSRQQQEQDDGSGGMNQPVDAARGDDVGSSSRAGKQSAERATVFRRESEYHERSERQLERSQVQSRDNEELGEAEVDELLMHMSLADDGQVSALVDVSARDGDLTAECPLWRHVFRMADAVGGCSREAASAGIEEGRSLSYAGLKLGGDCENGRA